MSNFRQPSLASIDQQTLASAIRQSSMDGQTVTIDLDFLQKRAVEQNRFDLAMQFNNYVRPTVMRANFSGSFGGYGHYRP